MGVNCPDDVKDELLARIAESDIMHVCSGEPANYAGIAAVTLGSVALTPGDGAGDFTVADGDTSGRKITIAQQTVTPTGTGNVTHIVFANTGTSEFNYVNTCTSFAVSVGVAFNVASFDVVEVRDAT